MVEGGSGRPLLVRPLPKYRMLSITTPATSRALTTVPTLETALGAEAAALSPDLMALLIDQASAIIVGYLGVSLASETVQEIIRPAARDRSNRPVLLSRWPVTAIASVTADGSPLTADIDYEASLAAGMVWRLSGSALVAWTGYRVTFTYTAGYVLPGTAGRTLPVDIEACAIDLVRYLNAGRSRDPALRSQSVLNGLVSESFYNGNNGAETGMPGDIAYRLAPYRTVRL